MRSRPVLTLGLAGLALAALTGSVISVPASASNTPSVAANVIVSGQITGTSSPGGIRVALYAMPRQPVMVRLIKASKRIQGKLVGVTTSSASGAYAIRDTDPAAITSSAFYGVVNLEVWAAGHGYWTVHGMARRIAAGHKLAPLFGPARAVPQEANLAMLPQSASEAAASPASAADGCWVLAPGGDLGPVNADLEGLWSTIDGVQKHLSYTTGATSGTGMGLSTNYGNSWTADNADANENSVTNTVGAQRFPVLKNEDSKIGQTQVEEGFFEPCQIAPGDYATFPYAVNGGDYWSGTHSPKATHCVQELAGGGFNMNKTQSITFSSGINLSVFGFGISLSSLTGYSHTASIEYDYSRNGFACGQRAKPFRGNAGGIVADRTVHGNG
jgi:hypothetical protein